MSAGTDEMVRLVAKATDKIGRLERDLLAARAQRDDLVDMLIESGMSKTEIAAHLGISRVTLHQKLKRRREADQP